MHCVANLRHYSKWLVGWQRNISLYRYPTRSRSSANVPFIHTVQRIVTEWRMDGWWPPKAVAKLRRWIANKPWPGMMLHWQFLIIPRTRKNVHRFDTQSELVAVTRPREWWFAFNGAFQLNFSSANFFLAYLFVPVVSPDWLLLFAANILCMHRPRSLNSEIIAFLPTLPFRYEMRNQQLSYPLSKQCKFFTFQLHPQHHHHHLHPITRRLNWFRNLCAMKCHSWKTMDDIIDFAWKRL